jgi:hypothetical protein
MDEWLGGRVDELRIIYPRYGVSYSDASLL